MNRPRVAQNTTALSVVNNGITFAIEAYAKIFIGEDSECLSTVFFKMVKIAEIQRLAKNNNLKLPKSLPPELIRDFHQSGIPSKDVFAILNPIRADLETLQKQELLNIVQTNTSGRDILSYTKTPTGLKIFEKINTL